MTVVEVPELASVFWLVQGLLEGITNRISPVSTCKLQKDKTGQWTRLVSQEALET